MRRSIKNKHTRTPDHVYQSDAVSRFINNLMWSGKKNTARTIVYGAFEVMKEKTKQDPLETFNEALRNVGPTMEVRSRRVGGANYQVPHEVRPERRMALAIRWIIDAARKKGGKAMQQRLADELLAASKNEGEAVKKKEVTHKMAESNKAFAHFAWGRK